MAGPARFIERLRAADRAQVEWLLIVLLLAALAAWNGPLEHLRHADGPGPPRWPDPTGHVAAAGPIERVDLWLYDAGLRLGAREPDPRVVIVAIDEDSIAQIGRWPWPRDVIATLVDRIAALGPRSLAIDVLFTERSEAPDEDRRLALALARSRAILAVAREPLGPQASGDDGTAAFLPLYPLPEIAGGNRVAHVVMTHGADGLVRGLFGAEGHLPALALALVDPQARPDIARADRMLAQGRWDRERPWLPAGLTGPPETISAAALLTGQIAPDRIAGRHLIVGATAVGLGDRFSTPLYADRLQAAGVELHALAAASLLDGRVIAPSPPWLHASASFAVIVVVMTLLYRTSPAWSLLACATAIALIIVATLSAMQADRWLRTGGLLVAVGIAYPLWSWRRLSAAAAGLLRQTRNLRLDVAIFADPARSLTIREPIARRLGRLADAANQVRRLNRFLLDGLESLPHPVLVADPAGAVIYRNRRMIDAFGAAAPAVGASVVTWFDACFEAQAVPLRLEPDAASGIGSERTDTQGRQWLVSLNRTGLAGPAPAIADEQRWLLQLVDISALRAAEREREEALSFLSHDLRSPQTSILAMTESLEPGHPAPLDHAALVRHARRALELTDEFLAFARAGSKSIDWREFDWVDLVTEVVDLSWQKAGQRGVQLRSAAAVDEAVVRCDIGLIRRALLNLVENAIRHCRVGGEVSVVLTQAPQYWSIAVADEGPGIAEAELGSLFRAFWQAPDGSASAGEIGAAGLGLAMVERTMSRHGGCVIGRNRTDRQGAIFEIRLPRGSAAIMPTISKPYVAADARTQSHDGAPGAA